MFAEVYHHLKDYLNKIPVEQWLVLNHWERLFISSLIVVNEADSVVRDDLHYARGLLLKRKDRWLLISLILVFNVFNCLHHFFKIDYLASFDVPLYWTFDQITNLSIVCLLLVQKDIIHKSAWEEDTLGESYCNGLEFTEKEYDVILFPLRVLAKNIHDVNHNEAAKLEVFVLPTHLFLDKIIENRDLINGKSSERMYQGPDLSKT